MFILITTKVLLSLSAPSSQQVLLSDLFCVLLEKMTSKSRNVFETVKATYRGMEKEVSFVSKGAKSVSCMILIQLNRCCLMKTSLKVIKNAADYPSVNCCTWFTPHCLGDVSRCSLGFHFCHFMIILKGSSDFKGLVVGSRHRSRLLCLQSPAQTLLQHKWNQIKC